MNKSDFLYPRHPITTISFLLSIGLGLLSCTQTSSESKVQNKLTLTGSSTVAPLASEMAKRFEAEYPGVRIDVQTGGSSRGFADPAQGLADIGMVSRALSEEEGQEFRSFAIASDGIGMIVHADNPISALSDDQVVQIYLDKVNNWQVVGGKSEPITVVNKAEGRSTLELFLKYFQVKNSQIQVDVVIGDNQQGIKTVAGNENAIGYVSIGAAEYDMAQGTPIKLLPVGGVAATTDNVQNGTFPLSRTLNFITKEQPSGLTQEFIEFAQSEKVHDLVEAQNFVPLTAQSVSQNP